MRILQINSGNYGSTGNIMLEIAESVRSHGDICITSCPDGRSMRKKQLNDHIYIGGKIKRNLHILFSKYTGFHDCLSLIDTIIYLRKVKVLNPDIIHLHNLHDSYLNIPMLFRYIKKNNMRVVWTLHDCWPFTGCCPYFVIANCYKWETECFQCPNYKEYPSSAFDRSRIMWRLKRKWFTGVQSMTLVTPSEWLANLTRSSFLKNYPVKVINNGIDTSIFRPMKSDFKNRYNLSDKRIVLGVALVWESRKGIDVFIELANRLPNNYRIVLVGTDNVVDQQLPSSIISIHRTQNREELAEIYSAADVFVNPTREENFPTVNMEALACGTPVITFKTGGSQEIIDETCGFAVETDDIDTLADSIIQFVDNNCFDSEACLKRALSFEKQVKYKEYLELYESILNV